MTEHADQLREAFEAHEYLAPDAASVYAGVHDLSRTYKRRRLGAQVAGGAVLGAGLIAGGIALPSFLPGGVHQEVVVQAPAAAPAADPTTPPPTDAEVAADLKADFGAGYDLDSAQKLAVTWGMSSELGPTIEPVKVEAGRRILAGETLPVKPDPLEAEDATKVTEAEAFFKAGYDYKDAKHLAKLWKTDTTWDAKALAGKKLLAGETLPFQP